MGGAGSGRYNMSSTIGGAFGLAISSAVYLGIRGPAGTGGEGAVWLPSIIEFVGRQDNIANREGAMIALLVNVLMLVAAIISIMVFVPKHQKAFH